MSAKQSNCSLHEILQTPCGSSRDKESHVFLSECNADISAHLLSCHLSKCGDVTEAELIMVRVGIVGCRRHNSHTSPSAQDTDTRLEDSGERQSHANTLSILGKLQVWRENTS